MPKENTTFEDFRRETGAAIDALEKTGFSQKEIAERGNIEELAAVLDKRRELIDKLRVFLEDALAFSAKKTRVPNEAASLAGEIRASLLRARENNLETAEILRTKQSVLTSEIKRINESMTGFLKYAQSVSPAAVFDKKG
jgi:hypothetical protein